MVAINTDILDKYQIGKNGEKKDPSRILQQDFLKLMTTQLKNQDPIKPADNGQFLGQMAQFGTVSGLKELQASFSKLASTLESNQILMAATLIDKHALVPTDSIKTSHDAEPVSGVVALPESASNGTVEVIDAAGNVIRTIDAKKTDQGSASFTWDGKNQDGEAVAAGTYSFRATVGTGDSAEAAPLYLNLKIGSISVDKGQISINTNDGQKHSFTDVLRIG